MFKFTFDGNNIKTAAAKPGRRAPVNIQHYINAKESKKSLRAAAQSQRDEESRLAEMDAPFALHNGDSWEIIHSSLPKYSGKSKRGTPYARQLKSLLRKNNSGYERVLLSPSDFTPLLNDKKLKPYNGKLEGFRPSGSSVSRQTTKFLRTIDNARAADNQGAPVSDNTNGTLDPDDPINLIRTHRRGALRRMLNSYAPFKSGKNLCVCGETQENHVSPSSAREHHEKTGEHLEIHDYLPQTIGFGDAGHEIRAKRSPHLFSMRPDRSGNVRLLKAFDKEDGPRTEQMPVVRVGLEADEYTRYTRSEYAQEGKGQRIQRAISSVTNALKKCPACNGTKKINPDQNENAVDCGDCSVDKIVYKEKVGEDGKPTLEPYTRGLGNGKQEYINPDDAPICKTCRGEKKLQVADRSNNTTIDCPDCDVTGRDTSAITCNNCHSENGAIRLTTDNTCKSCSGKGFFETTVKPSFKKIKTNTDSAERRSGNARYALEYKSDTSAATGVDAWKAHGDKECTRCHGDDESQMPSTGLPCNCRITSHEDSDSLPSGLRLIHPNHIIIPENHYQRALARAYGGNLSTSPHEISHEPNYIDPDTNQTPSQTYGIGTSQEYKNGTKKIPDSAILGVWSLGKQIPQKVLQRLNDKSRKNWSSKNAKFTASSADLTDIKTELEQMHTWPDLIPSEKATEGSVIERQRQKRMRVNPEDYPSDVKPHVSKVERTMAGLPDYEQGRYNADLDEIYENASSGAFDRLGSNVDRLLSNVKRFSGPETHDRLSESISGLKELAGRKESPKTEESANV